MKLTVVGCSGGGPGPDSAASCYLVEADGFHLLLDLGDGALGPLQRHLAPHRIDAILLSHLHMDHCIDVASLWVALKYAAEPPSGPVVVYGPPNTERRLATAYGPPVDSEYFGSFFDFRTYPAGDFTLGPFAVRTAPAVHPVPAYSMRVEHDGRSLTFSGDTAPNVELAALAAGTDLLLCEATNAGADAGSSDGHMSGSDVGRLAAAARVGRLVLTHVPAWESVDVAVAAARSAFDGVLVAARPGQVHEI